MQPASLTVLAGLSLAVSLGGALATFRTIRSVPRLSPAPQSDRDWPRISIIVTARDEEATIEAALRTKLTDDYPNLELIVVDDRSSDATSQIVDRLAAEDARLVPLHITELPVGWLGKVHAMHRAHEIATGDWILFSDADVHLAPGALRATIRHCETHGLDHVAALPDLWESEPLVDSSLSALFRFLLITARLWKLGDPKSSATIGGGGFNFVRKALLDRIGGFDDVRLDVLDDILLGQRVKKAGGKQGAVHAIDFVGLHFYRSLREMARGCEKNSFAMQGYSVSRLVISTIALLAIELVPYAAIHFGSHLAVLLGAASALVALGTSLAIARWMRRPMPAVLLGPIGGVLLVLMTARASILALWRGEIVWRDTRYSLAELKRGARFEFPI